MPGFAVHPSTGHHLQAAACVGCSHAIAVPYNEKNDIEVRETSSEVAFLEETVNLLSPLTLLYMASKMPQSFIRRCCTESQYCYQYSLSGMGNQM